MASYKWPQNAGVASINGDTTAAQIITATNPLQASTSSGTTTIATKAPVTLTDGATVAINAALGDVFILSAGGNRTLLAPTNATNGQIIEIVHYAVSSDRTLSLTTGSSGSFAFNDDITALSATTASKHDKLFFQYLQLTNRWNIFAYSKNNP